MEIKVTGCHDCPLKTVFLQCIPLGKISVINEFRNNDFHPYCPLQTEEITIKKKDNDNTGICKEKG